MRSTLFIVLLAVIATADDFPKTRVPVSNYLSSALTTDIVTAGITSIYQSVANKTTFKVAITNFKNAAVNKVMSQSKFIGPALTLSGHVSSVSNILSEVTTGISVCLKPAFKNLKKQNVKTTAVFDNKFSKVLSKKFFKKCYADVKAAVVKGNPSDWKYAVNDLYSVIQFAAVGIPKQ
ncbi:unnamed protein product [Bursaphelenchus xylophilus]|uniref:(pine wood nematode) hypothetical protein n=1 Tax=Bursaphelenchus xylophilus TaxID=6326 RepID=A0A1I7S7W1_BURXY|nr:unnamed protein product [Bursaphelenchus xylophilus]CAG9087127.1 unnamed protein product [Bursaphelenchus xylophilus]